MRDKKAVQQTHGDLDRNPARVRLRVPAPSGVEVPNYSNMPARAVPLVIPERTWSPPVAPIKKARRKMEAQRKIKTDDEHGIAWMQYAVVLMFDIEARLPGGGGANVTAWPLQTLADPDDDEAEARTVRRAVLAAEIKFRDDVLLLLVRAAKLDPLGAKLVAYHARRRKWDELIKLDPQRRTRQTLDKIRRAALLAMAQADRAEGLDVVSRAERYKDHNG